MFTKARLKLTLWYLLIIMMVSGFFSILVYRGFEKEIGRGFRMQIMHGSSETGLIIRDRNGFQRILPFVIYPDEVAPREVSEIINLAKRRFALQLIIINGGILLFAGTAGYFLAGKTLQPIELMVEEQKRFVTDASHELKTPLTALTTSLEVALKDKKLGLKSARRALKDSLEEVYGLKNLANDLLSLTRYQQSGSNLAFSEFKIKKVIESAYKNVLPLAIKKKIKVKIKVTDANLKANRDSLEKLIIILLDNAIKYTPQGGSVNILAKKDQKSLTLEVKDTGIGISKKDIPHVFDRFYRADPSRSKLKVPGYGLGLSMAKKITDRHSGSISVKSTSNKGSTFIVKLPL